MALLTKQDILNAPDRAFEEVPVPEWGGAVRVKSLSGRERDAFEASLVKGSGKNRSSDFVNMRARLCAVCIVDEAGTRVFEDNEVEMLGAKSAAALDRVFGVAQRLSGMSDEDVKELEKNSGAGPAGASPSA